MESFMKLFVQLLGGMRNTLWLFSVTLVFALPLGLLLALGRRSKSKILSGAIRVYNLIIRGTPLMLQLIVVYIAPFNIFGVTWDRMTAAIVAFILNYAAYFSEIFRSGIGSIPRGQYEAAKVLGLSKWTTNKSIILPQVIKRILPPMSSEFMTLVKDTALASTLSIVEMFTVAQNNAMRTFDLTPLYVAGIFYFVFNAIVEQLFHLAERKLDYYH